jgi:hypothetical protein
LPLNQSKTAKNIAGNPIGGGNPGGREQNDGKGEALGAGRIVIARSSRRHECRDSALE